MTSTTDYEPPAGISLGALTNADDSEGDWDWDACDLAVGSSLCDDETTISVGVRSQGLSGKLARVLLLSKPLRSLTYSLGRSSRVPKQQFQSVYGPIAEFDMVSTPAYEGKL